MRIVWTLLGAVGLLLGWLWLLQGLALVEIRPILCLAACEPVTGRSVLWAVVGLVVLVLGLLALRRAFRGAL